MARFLFGAFTGLILIGAMLIAWAFVFPLQAEQSEPASAVIPAPAPEPEAAVETQARIETQAVVETDAVVETVARIETQATVETEVVAPLFKPDIKEEEPEAAVPVSRSAALDVPEVKPLPVPELTPAQVEAARAALQSQGGATSSSARPKAAVVDRNTATP